MGRTRLLDIARQVGVSEATVSRVLNDRSGVSEKTRSAVLEAARRLGRLAPQMPALSVGRSVGVVVPDLENPIFAQWLERIEAHAFEADATVQVAMRVRTRDRERAAVDRFLQAGASGIIMVSGFHAYAQDPPQHYRDLIAAGVPLVLVNGVREGLDAAFISTDDSDAIDAAVRHLRELGHRRIGLAVGDEHTWPVRAKIAAFERSGSAERAGDRPIAFTDFSRAGGYEAAGELVRRGATAIVCGSDVMATGVLEGARAAGLRVPGDLSVVGYDDIPQASMTTPPLTTIRQDVDAMARAAVRAALGGGDRSRRPVRTELVVRPQLVVRGSTGAAPGSRADTMAR